ncbi:MULTISPECIES: hypothetical protein [unclassified Streptomyces]|uniref:hypothetical protein n=1 Tax=unclassified Streptomyces TaxID=2593676 RepID=UPI0033FA5397
MKAKIRTGLFTAATAAALVTTLALPAVSLATPATGAASQTDVTSVAAQAPVRQKTNIRADQRNRVASDIPVPAGKSLYVVIHATDDDTPIDVCSGRCIELRAGGSAQAVFSAGNKPKTAGITMRAVDPTGSWTTVTWSYWVA